jgi:hypothetical protein
VSFVASVFLKCLWSRFSDKFFSVVFASAWLDPTTNLDIIPEATMKRKF